MTNSQAFRTKPPKTSALQPGDVCFVRDFDRIAWQDIAAFANSNVPNDVDTMDYREPMLPGPFFVVSVNDHPGHVLCFVITSYRTGWVQALKRTVKFEDMMVKMQDARLSLL